MRTAIVLALATLAAAARCTGEPAVASAPNPAAPGAAVVRVAAAVPGTLTAAEAVRIGLQRNPQVRAAAAAVPGTLTAAEAVRIGLQRNPQVRAAAAAAEAARAAYRALAALPAVEVSVTHARGSSSAPTLTGTTNDTFVDVSETIDVSGQRRCQAAAAHAQWGAAQYAHEETRLKLEQDIRDAYWSLAAARAGLAAADEALLDADRVYNLTVVQEQAGASPLADVVRAGIDRATVRQARAAARGAEAAALAVLNTLLARAPAQPAALADALSASDPVPPPIASLPSLEALQTLAAANRPLLQQARQAVLAARYALRQAQASRFPDLSIDYERSLQQTQAGEAISVTARFPLLDLGSVSQGIRAAAAAEKQARAQLADAEQQVAQQVAQAAADYAQARELADSCRTEILQPSIRILDMARTGYEHGATGILPVMDAAATLRNARSGCIGALLAVHRARSAIYAATGGLTPSPGPAGAAQR